MESGFKWPCFSYAYWPGSTQVTRYLFRLDGRCPLGGVCPDEVGGHCWGGGGRLLGVRRELGVRGENR